MRNKSVVSKIIKINELNDKTINEMYTLFSKYFVSEKETFIKDLKNKDYIIIIKDNRNSDIVGFSTIEYIQLLLFKRNINIIYSGDTIVSEKFRNENDLLKAFVRFNLNNFKNNEEVYWYLISMGFRTYRFLPIFFKEFWPRYDDKTPAKIKHIIDTLGEMKFRDLYIKDKGIIKQASKCYLREPYNEIPSYRLNNPHIRFFLENNPGYIKGDELACLAKFTPENFNPIVFRRLYIDH